MRKTLNLINSKESEIEYKIHNFPDGHIHLKLEGGFNKEERINVICRINNANDMFILQQLKQILDLNDMKIQNLKILYLFTARCDRRFSNGEAFDLKLIANQINELEALKIEIFDVHSDRLQQFLNYYDIYAIDEFNIKKYRLCFPDKGSNDRLNKTPVSWYHKAPTDKIYNQCCKYKPIICDKNRTLDGEISKIFPRIIPFVNKKDNSNYFKKPILVIDDICDGGATFVSAGALLLQQGYKKISLFVTHAIQEMGIRKVAALYDEVFITNSYYDWDQVSLPDNVTVIKID